MDSVLACMLGNGAAGYWGSGEGRTGKASSSSGSFHPKYPNFASLGLWDTGSRTARNMNLIFRLRVQDPEVPINRHLLPVPPGRTPSNTPRAEGRT